MAGIIEEVEGKAVVIRFDGKRCIHARNCVLGRPDVFVPNAEGEWIHPDRATPEAVAILAYCCPSGAITYERRDGGANEAPPKVNVVRLRENGPLAFHAPLAIEGSDEGLRATLCRCGASKNKPFCDGSHGSANFAATGEPAVQPMETLASRDGPLEVTPIANGPLRAVGALEVESGTGRTIGRATETYLCRCGGSAKKPYCDGSHKKLGFRSDV